MKKIIFIIIIALVPFVSKGYNPTIDSLINNTLDKPTTNSKYNYSTLFDMEVYTFQYENMEISVTHMLYIAYRREERWGYDANYKNGKYVFYWNDDISEQTKNKLRNMCLLIKGKK